MVIDTLSAALEYASRGWRVFPVRGKVPVTPRGYLDATTDTETIRSWWSGGDLGVAIATGNGLVVVDLDRRHTRDPGSFPRTRTVRTGHGWHLYYSGESRCAVTADYDLRGEGGYVVAPPSQHTESGRRYEVAVEAPLATLPDELRVPPSPRITTPTESSQPPVIDGQRNQVLTSLAGSLRRLGLGHDAIVYSLGEINRERCSPPLPEDEVAGIASSVSRYHRGALEVHTDPSVLGWGEISAPVGEPRWVCRRLLLAPGAPALLVGPGGSGKTFLAQALAVAVGSGRPWGPHRVSAGPVLHLDYEQGDHTCRSRYRSLAHQAGVESADIRLVVFPPKLSSPHTADWLARAAIGCRLILIDSLRASVRADENSSEVREWLDLLGRISDDTQAAVLVIHHSVKAPPDGPVYALPPRGSSAIEDACSTVWVVVGDSLLCRKSRLAERAPALRYSISRGTGGYAQVEVA